MTAVDAWPTIPADQLPLDPWPHEHGEDPAHLLTADGHVPHHIEPLARLLGPAATFAPRQPHEHHDASPAATYLIGTEMVAFVVVALLILATSLPAIGA